MRGRERECVCVFVANKGINKCTFKLALESIFLNENCFYEKKLTGADFELHRKSNITDYFVMKNYEY